MAKTIIMPKFGFTQESAEIVRWLKHEGETVEAGDPIAEVTTDKVNMEVEATATGILAGLRYKEGDVVPVTEVIAYVLAPDEKVPEGAPAAFHDGGETQVKATAPQEARPRVQATPVAEQMAREKGLDLSLVAGSGPGGRVTRGDVEGYLKAAGDVGGKLRATPAARRAAQEMGIELGQVTGSGPRGRVQGADVRQAAASMAVPAAAPQALFSTREAESLPLTGIRRTIAERMQRSAQEAPHIYFEADIDAGSLEDLRQRGNARLSDNQPRISLTALLVRAVAWTLARHLLLNSQLSGDKILLLPDVHVGVAVAAESGLIVPVVHQAGQKSVTQIAAELEDLTARARQGKLLPDDVAGGTFTISNLGMFGVDRFTAIINPPQSAILAVGRMRKMVVPGEDDRPVVRSIMTITLGADHRVVDGAAAARFLADLRECLEHPELMAL
jgi:pyruvate dehydrogenase E2 component (dihydrolipoamide acetyltransferase)